LERFDRTRFARRIGIQPDGWQKELLDSSSERILLNCSRQSGKSTIAAILALLEALYTEDSLTLILAPAERQARETFSKVAAMYHKLGYTADSDRKLGLQLDNGSRIEALPGSERTIRGFSGVSLLVVDEAARVDDELFYAARPMLAVSEGKMLLLSTPYSKQGAFYEAWVSEDNWQRFEIPATLVPRISEEFLEEERRSLPARVFKREYLCSFEDSESRVFTWEDIQAAKDDRIPPLFSGGFEQWKATRAFQ